MRILSAALAVTSLSLLLPAVASAQEPAPLPVPAPPPDPPKLPPPPEPPHATPATPSNPALGLTSLRLMHEKGILSDAEYESALRDVGDSTGAAAEHSNAVVLGKFSTVFYGFLEADTIYDTTQSFNDGAGGTLVQRPGPLPTQPPGPATHYAADHGRTMFSVRNSRFGFRLGAPEVAKVRTSAQLEFDFLGSQPAGTEAAFFTSPNLRVRHANIRIETDYVDVLIGQYWDLFGWQGVYHPNTVEIQGVPGQLYTRTPQIRVSKTMKTSAVTVEAAVAAMRPPSRNSEFPEGQAGLRFALNNVKAMMTNGATATALMPASIAVTGDFRRIQVPEFSQLPTHSVNQNTAALAVDAFIPVIPATKDRKANSLALNGELVTGYGISDFYTGFTGGITMPSLPNTTGVNPPPAYPQDIDDGMVTFDQNGTLHPIQWTSYLIGLQYYLPGLDGKVWISANYSHMESSNSSLYSRQQALTNPATVNYVSSTLVLASSDWFDFNLFADVGALRLGAEYANFNDQYADGVHAINHRFQLSGFFRF